MFTEPDDVKIEVTCSNCGAKYTVVADKNQKAYIKCRACDAEVEVN